MLKKEEQRVCMIGCLGSIEEGIVPLLLFFLLCRPTVEGPSSVEPPPHSVFGGHC